MRPEATLTCRNTICSSALRCKSTARSTSSRARTERSIVELELRRSFRELIEFMVQTYIRPTDIAVLKHKHKHKHVHRVTRHGIDFIELRHPATKRHRNHMLGTELALNRYQSILRRQGRKGVPAQDDYLFLPEMANRESALDALATQFTALLEMTNLRQDAEGKPRTLYSLRHTAIVRSIQKGLPLEMIAANSRTSSEMIRRFYGSHVKSVLYMGQGNRAKKFWTI